MEEVCFMKYFREKLDSALGKYDRVLLGRKCRAYKCFEFHTLQLGKSSDVCMRWRFLVLECVSQVVFMLVHVLFKSCSCVTFEFIIANGQVVFPETRQTCSDLWKTPAEPQAVKAPGVMAAHRFSWAVLLWGGQAGMCGLRQESCWMSLSVALGHGSGWPLAEYFILMPLCYCMSVLTSVLKRQLSNTRRLCHFGRCILSSFLLRFL